MILPSSSSALRRRAYSLVEIVIAAAISSSVAIPIMATFIYVAKSIATSSNQAQVRILADSALNRLAQDVRDSSNSAYNRTSAGGTPWPPVTGNTNADAEMKLTLLSAADGSVIEWTYARAGNKQLTRTRSWYQGAALQTETKGYLIRFENLIFTETRLVDALAGGGLGAPAVSSIRLVGRCFLSIPDHSSYYREIDGNGDGNYQNDIVGRDLFGLALPSIPDDPKWQYIFNLNVAFRNS